MLTNPSMPELVGADTGVTLSNLNLLAERQSRLSESLLATLSELADAIIADADGDRDAVDSLLLSLTDESGGRAMAETSPVNREGVAAMANRAGLYPRLILYRMIEERMPLSDNTPRRPSELPDTARGRISYMPSAFANKAYLHLSDFVDSPRSSEAAGFADACEEVQSGLAEYCILPMEHTGSGKLTAFARLMLTYRLEIIAAVDLENAAEGQVTRFALLRTARRGMPSLTASDAPLLIELLHLSDKPSLSDLLAAAELCGMSLYRVDTLPTPDGEGSESLVLDCVLNATGSDIATFLRFLSLEAAEDHLAGIYTVV